MEPERLNTVVRFFKALADESRLRLLGTLAGQECSVEELASRLGLTPPTVSHHLNKLKELGLVQMQPEGTTHVYRLNPEALREMSKTVLTPEKMASLVDSEEGGEAWERKVLRDFFEGERLKEIPASRKKRSVILKWLASQFEPDRRYPEREVNEIIKRYHPDAATLRRELIGSDLMQREGGIYWRAAESTRERKWAY
ncbi:MAG TPA: metalloregulator ArsR/SmtB family transcription factor [Chloroflexota bacterium]|nr:metalloregulator ArsR/SmtB family transcription factor [Chloroflexota bacterium]